MRLRWPISDEERPWVTRFALVFAAIIVGWACLHDLNIIRVEPRHFTVYHEPLLPLGHHALLAFQYASIATFGPGLAFGFLAYAACRAGRRAPVPLGRAAAGFVGVIVVVELVLLAVATWARARVEQGAPPPYPLWIYPDLSPGIVFTQTANVTAVLLAPTAGAAYLAVLFARRTRANGAAPSPMSRRT